MRTFEYRGHRVDINTQDYAWTRKNGIDIWIDDDFKELKSTLPEAEKRARQLIDAHEAQ